MFWQLANNIQYYLFIQFQFNFRVIISKTEVVNNFQSLRFNSVLPQGFQTSRNGNAPQPTSKSSISSVLPNTPENSNAGFL